ncbi:SOS response-associated peptidase [Bhargavaea ginsengi]|uniref:SOS response-associated peptidase n=1 Tax=Bhargavaea ginsengi TaxID=426757 RepID=UPI0020421661|nr:SOS response-associated peptidase [Bhargavaea ginsengi]MCM3086540.1 SOS response-associated peptidase [Bhargavaea ginsengi]
MCGRFTLYVPYGELIARFGITRSFEEVDFSPSYNIAPTQQVVAVISDGRENRMGKLRWGLVPGWAKDLKIGSRMINARAETLSEKPSFRQAFERQRCIIPADSFYEWQREGDIRRPMRIRLKDEEVFGMAGLWETWISPNGEKVHTCTAITTRPNRVMEKIHDRMPVILEKSGEEEWLNPDNRDIESLNRLLVPYDADRMEAYEVSSAVNSPKNNSPELIVPFC